MPADTNQSYNQQLTDAFKQNQALLEQIYQSTEKTRQYIFWIKILTILKIVLIVVPIIIALLFFLPMLKNVIDLYTGAGFGQGAF